MNNSDHHSPPHLFHSTPSQTDDDIFQASGPPSQLKSKQYQPPKADSDTFPTQQEFLTSLKAISVGEVDENDRKCSICWKPYGEEPDPGFDNSEMPVKLRCGHIYGNKCLGLTYRAPETKTHSLKPLNFDHMGANGSILMQKLSAFIRGLRVGFPNVFENIDTMLVVSCPEEHGIERGNRLFGEYWWRILKGMTTVV